VRECPSVNCQHIGTIFDQNQDYTILGQSGSGMWLQIDFQGRQGWICKAYTTVGDAVLDIPFTSEQSENCSGNAIASLASTTPTPTVTPTFFTNASTASNGAIAFVSLEYGNAIRVVDSQSLQPTPLTSALSTTNVSSVKFSPNGQYLAYTVYSATAATLTVVDTTTKQSRTLIESFDGKFDWSPDSQRIVYSRAPFDPYAISDPQGLWVVDVASGQSQELIRPLGQSSLSYPDWSPDGAYIRFVEFGTTVIGDYIVAHADGSGVVNSVSIPFRVGSDWSPDGTKFVYDDNNAYEFGNRSLYLVNFDGSGQRTLYKSEGFSASSPLWSPSGEYVAFWRQNETTFQSSVWVINSTTGEAFEVPNSSQSRPLAWSPDSSKIITVGEGNTLKILPLDGTSIPILGVGNQVSWQGIASQPVDLTSAEIEPSPTQQVLVLGYRTDQQDLPDLAHHSCNGNVDHINYLFLHFDDVVRGFFLALIHPTIGDLEDMRSLLQSTSTVMNLTNPDWRATYIDIRYHQDEAFASRVDQVVALNDGSSNWESLVDKRNNAQLTYDIMLYALAGSDTQLQAGSAGFQLFTLCLQADGDININIHEYWRNHN
jgi:Tol biopolymer transport system component